MLERTDVYIMRPLFIALYLVFAISTYGQSGSGSAKQVPALRTQTFGELHAMTDPRTYQFDSAGLVMFSNGYLISRGEFLQAWKEANLADTSQKAKAKFLDDYILRFQKIAEAMNQELDTVVAFQIEYLKFKQELITPYLNAGKTRLEAEAMDSVKYALRTHYGDQLIRVLNYKEIWSEDTDENLRQFYSTHDLYQGQTFETSKTKVVFDLNKELETKLKGRVQNNFPFAINPRYKGKL
jgi:hypothetical protein